MVDGLDVARVDLGELLGADDLVVFAAASAGDRHASSLADRAIGSELVDQARVTANGIDFAYLEAGPADGPLALCLHGFPDHARTWEPLLGELADDGLPRGGAVDARLLTRPASRPTATTRSHRSALDAIALADALAGDGAAVLVGHDWGAIASYTAVGHRAGPVRSPRRHRRAARRRAGRSTSSTPRS